MQRRGGHRSLLRSEPDGNGLSEFAEPKSAGLPMALARLAAHDRIMVIVRGDKGARSRLADYSFGRIVVEGRPETRDLIVLPNRVVRDWWRQDGHRLVHQDLAEVLDELPRRLLIGTGAYGRMEPDPRLLDELRARGIIVEVLPTDEAVRRYGELDPVSIAAAIHLTC